MCVYYVLKVFLQIVRYGNDRPNTFGLAYHFRFRLGNHSVDWCVYYRCLNRLCSGRNVLNRTQQLGNVSWGS